MTNERESEKADPLPDCINEIERRYGIQTPEFVEVQDGFYTQRLVIDTPISAGWIDNDSRPTIIESHCEPLAAPIPRYRKELTWQRNF